jgi:hypothetical protein
MLKCPFCQYENEDGALFCEQCKSDLSSVEPAAGQQASAVPVAAVVETIPLAEAAPATPVVEAQPVSEVPEQAPLAAAPLPEPLPGMTPPPVEAPVVMPEPQATAPAPPAAAPAAPAAASAAAPAAPAAPEAGQLPPGASPKLVVIRGQKIGVEFPIYPELNFIGRADEKPVDIDLEDQEPPDRIWCSRQHAVINFEDNRLTIEDLNSSNGTYVNRTRVYPGQKRPLNVGDVIQIGTVQLKVKV